MLVDVQNQQIDTEEKRQKLHDSFNTLSSTVHTVSLNMETGFFGRSLLRAKLNKVQEEKNKEIEAARKGQSR